MGIYRKCCFAVVAALMYSTSSANDCIDTGIQGDGWGWDGTQSCRIEITAGDCIDFDGDGWGWDGVGSCRTDTVTPPITNGNTVTEEHPAFTVAPTGQTISYLSGDDGDLRIADTTGSRFVDNGNGTFTDTRTDLTWLGVRQCIVERSWFAAINFANQLSASSTQCAELNDGSVSGTWRLPNINELFSLADFGNQIPAFADGIPFTGTWNSNPWLRYWSSTSFHTDPTVSAWVFNADLGQVTPRDKTTQARAFAVRD